MIPGTKLPRIEKFHDLFEIGGPVDKQRKALAPLLVPSHSQESKPSKPDGEDSAVKKSALVKKQNAAAAKKEAERLKAAAAIAQSQVESTRKMLADASQREAQLRQKLVDCKYNSLFMQSESTRRYYGETEQQERRPSTETKKPYRLDPIDPRVLARVTPPPTP